MRLQPYLVTFQTGKTLVYSRWLPGSDEVKIRRLVGGELCSGGSLKQVIS